MRQKVGLISAPILFLLILLAPTPEGLNREAHVVLATVFLMAGWWVTEALPIPATALVPLVVFPLFGVASAGEISTAYMDRNIVLFMGGFFLAMAIQKWGLHRRIALAILSSIGGNLPRLVLGFMIATAFLSMWVSNTATAIMMLPIGTAVILRLQKGGLPKNSRFPVVLLLGIAYSASIGGVATLIGTPPNIVFAGQFSQLFPDKPEVSFVRWMAVGLPFTLLFLPVAWLYLTHVYARLEKVGASQSREAIRTERARLGPMSRGETRAALVFAFTALAWIFLRDLPVGAIVIPGWSSLLGVEDYVHDATVAMISTLILFATPVDWKRSEFLLDWDWAARIPWGVLILFGGGIALANAFQSSGLAAWVGGSLEVLHGVPPLLLVLAVCLMLTFLTEITSNTATATIFMPILAGTAVAMGVDPELLMIPAAISVSCAFMLPVATPPNAIIFASEHLTIPAMSRAGLWLNLMAPFFTTLVVYLFAVPAFGLD